MYSFLAKNHLAFCAWIRNHSIHFSFQSFDEKVANVSLAFELMMDGGLPQPKARPEDIVNLDLKSTLRVLYNLFTKYKHLS